MISFKKFLAEMRNMSPHEAHAIFKKHGVSGTESMSYPEIKKAHRSLISKLHPDRGGKIEHAQEVNSAFDALKSHKPGGQAYAHPQSTGQPRPFNPRDINSIKERLNSKAGPNAEHLTVHQFDGSFFRHVFSVRGGEENHKDIADSMHQWGSHGANPYPTHSIFVTKGSEGHRNLHLIWANGKHVAPGHSIEHDSFNQNPANDMHLMRKLKTWVDTR